MDRAEPESDGSSNSIRIQTAQMEIMKHAALGLIFRLQLFSGLQTLAFRCCVSSMSESQLGGKKGTWKKISESIMNSEARQKWTLNLSVWPHDVRFQLLTGISLWNDSI